MNARSMITAAAATVTLAAAASTVLAAPAHAATDAVEGKPTAVSTDDQLAAEKAGLQRLEAYESRMRTMPKIGKTHSYRFDTWPAFWSVVAVWSPTSGDVDLSVYDDKSKTQLLDQSRAGTGSTDFVAIDGNHRAAGDYYADVTTYGGEGTYFAEFARGLNTLHDENKTVAMGSDEIVRVYDTWLAAGETYTFTLKASSYAMNGDLYLVGSSPADPGTFVRPRSESLRAGTSSELGGTETFTFTPTVNDYYGIVVINEAAGGTYTLSRSS